MLKRASSLYKEFLIILIILWYAKTRNEKIDNLNKNNGEKDKLIRDPESNHEPALTIKPQRVVEEAF